MEKSNKDRQFILWFCLMRSYSLPVPGLGIKINIGPTVSGVLEGELNNTAVHSSRRAVVGATQPSNSTVQLTGDGCGPLWILATLV